MEFGKKITGKVQYIPKAILSESVIGSIYELRIKTSGVSDPTGAFNLLRTELPKKFPGLKVLWVRVETDTIYMQISGSPFAWAALLVFLPALLALIGIAVSLIAVFLVFAQLPGWIIGLFLVGVALIVVGPAIAKTLTAGLPQIQVTKT